MCLLCWLRMRQRLVAGYGIQHLKLWDHMKRGLVSLLPDLAEFLNRLTGVVRPTQDVALSEELALLSRRFELVARTFSQPLHYRCIGGASTFAGCAPPTCNGVFAWACHGMDVIFLCPLFWTGAGGIEKQATLLIHEGQPHLLGKSGRYDSSRVRKEFPHS